MTFKTLFETETPLVATADGETLQIGECVETSTGSIIEDGFIYDYIGPTHYTDYFMNTTTKTGVRYDWKNTTMCLVTNKSVEFNFDFQDNLHTLPGAAYDPQTSFRKMEVTAPTPTPSSGPTIVIVVSIVVATSLIVSIFAGQLRKRRARR